MKIEQSNQSEISCETEKSPTECFQLLKEVFGDNIMSRTRDFEWHKEFMATAETDAAERNISIGRESLHVYLGNDIHGVLAGFNTRGQS
jgi:hypothetical protein